MIRRDFMKLAGAAVIPAVAVGDTLTVIASTVYRDAVPNPRTICKVVPGRMHPAGHKCECIERPKMCTICKKFNSTLKYIAWFDERGARRERACRHCYELTKAGRVKYGNDPAMWPDYDKYLTVTTINLWLFNGIHSYV